VYHKFQKYKARKNKRRDTRELPISSRYEQSIEVVFFFEVFFPEKLKERKMKKNEK
jgi:hypothetical protein